MTSQTNKTAQELYLVRDAHRKLKSGEPLSDEEIAAAIKHFGKLVLLLEYIRDPIFELFLKKIWEELDKFKGFRKARKEKP